MGFYAVAVSAGDLQCHGPHLSARIQRAASDPSLLRTRVEKSLRINASIAWPACAVLASLSTPIIAYVFTPKWFPAQPLLYAYCVNAVMTSVGVPLTELFFSQNDAWFNLRLCLWWTIPTWTFGTYAVFHYGLLGFAVFQAALQGTWLLAFLACPPDRGLARLCAIAGTVHIGCRAGVGNLLLVRSGGLSSIYRLGAVLAVEAVVCGAFLMRMLLSWRAGAEPA